MIAFLNAILLRKPTMCSSLIVSKEAVLQFNECIYVIGAAMALEIYNDLLLYADA